MARSELWAGDEDVVKMFVAQAFPHIPGFGKAARAIGVAENLGHGWTLTGGIVLSPRAGGFDAELSILLRPGCSMSRKMLRTLFGLAFEHFELRRLTCDVAADNARSQSLVERLGWRREGVKVAGYDGENDAMVYGMTADECRWLRRD